MLGFATRNPTYDLNYQLSINLMAFGIGFERESRN
jgi:hypothetical protein